MTSVCAWCGEAATTSVEYAVVAVDASGTKRRKEIPKSAPACKPCHDRIEHNKQHPVELPGER